MLIPEWTHSQMLKSEDLRANAVNRLSLTDLQALCRSVHMAWHPQTTQNAFVGQSNCDLFSTDRQDVFPLRRHSKLSTMVVPLS